MEDEEGIAPPTLFDIRTGEDSEQFNAKLFEEIEETNDDLYSASLADAKCPEHEDDSNSSGNGTKECEECSNIKELVKKYQTHSCTFSCHKKHKYMKLHKKEGFGINEEEDEEEIIFKSCRFKFPRYPLDKTTLIFPLTKADDIKETNNMKKDLRHIKCYLIRRVQFLTNKANEEAWFKFKKMSFNDFLYDLGFYSDLSEDLSDDERRKLARQRYVNALRADIDDSGLVVKERSPSDVYINNYNLTLMPVIKSNHDLQNIINPQAVANYVTNYLTKNEGGTSKLLKTLEEETKDISKFEQLKKFASVLDKNREASIQECIYLLGGLPMSKFSTKVKFIATLHPNYRDGLLKANIEELGENESIFHKSIHQYYELRPFNVDDETENWDEMTLSEFVANYEVIVNPGTRDRSKLIELGDESGYIHKRTEPAVLRYYLKYEEPSEFARGLLILFHPFRNEYQDIHDKDVLDLVDSNKDIIEEKRKIFEKNQNLISLIEEIQKINQEKQDEEEEEEGLDQQDNDPFGDETTSEKDIKDFIESAKKTAQRDISASVDISVPGVETIRERFILLNKGQQRLFQDLCERFNLYSTVKDPTFLFLAGEAGKDYTFKFFYDIINKPKFQVQEKVFCSNCVLML